MLSSVLLDALRAYWRVHRPADWLFPGRDPSRPLHERSVQRAISEHPVRPAPSGGLIHAARCRCQPALPRRPHRLLRHPPHLGADPRPSSAPALRRARRGGRYTHRVAISNHRLVSLDDQQVRFRFKDYRGRRVRHQELPLTEFARRFLLHVLPPRFVRIRYYGILAHGCRSRLLARSRQALQVGAASSDLPPDPPMDAVHDCTGLLPLPQCLPRKTAPSPSRSGPEAPLRTVTPPLRRASSRLHPHSSSHPAPVSSN